MEQVKQQQNFPNANVEYDKQHLPLNYREVIEDGRKRYDTVLDVTLISKLLPGQSGWRLFVNSKEGQGFLGRFKSGHKLELTDLMDFERTIQSAKRAKERREQLLKESGRASDSILNENDEALLNEQMELDVSRFQSVTSYVRPIVSIQGQFKTGKSYTLKLLFHDSDILDGYGVETIGISMMFPDTGDDVQLASPIADTAGTERPMDGNFRKNI